MHENIHLQKKTIKAIKISYGLSRSDSVKSGSDVSRPTSPSPKKINIKKADKTSAETDNKKQI